MAAGEGVPVGCPGVQQHDHIAGHKAAVTLCHIIGVLPGGIIQVVFCWHNTVIPGTVHLPGVDLGDGISVGHVLVVKVLIEGKSLETGGRVAAVLTGQDGVAGHIQRGCGAQAFDIPRVAAVGERPARRAVSIFADHVGVIVGVGKVINRYRSATCTYFCHVAVWIFCIASPHRFTGRFY